MAKKKAETIEVIKPEVVKGIKATPKVNIGSNKNGSPRYPAGVEAEFTQEQIDNYKSKKII